LIGRKTLLESTDSRRVFSFHLASNQSFAQNKRLQAVTIFLLITVSASICRVGIGELA
jgi:hypothetical protein